MAQKLALGPILIRRQARKIEWETRRTTLRRLTPSSLSSRRPEAHVPRIGTEREADLSRLIGVSAHAVLEQWDFTGPLTAISRAIEQAIHRTVAQAYPALLAAVREDLTLVFKGFFSSEPYRILQLATVLGREVPFVMPVGEDQTMEGVIDLIYQLDGRIWIADYKTDDVAAEDVRGRVDRYRPQAESYARAVARSLGVPSIASQLIFLRPGVAVDV
jgi:ATP-dependent helicase/nuclease subunit A